MHWLASFGSFGSFESQGFEGGFFVELLSKRIGASQWLADYARYRAEFLKFVVQVFCLVCFSS
jgi:hypothetical protein